MAAKKKGVLIVIAIKARNLPNKQRIGKQDPYCTVTHNANTKRTKADKRGGQHPVWDEEFRFEIWEDLEEELQKSGAKIDQRGGVGNTIGSNGSASAPEESIARPKSDKTIHLACYADDAREPDLIGEGTVDIASTLKKGEFDDWVTIKNKGKYCGEIYLEMTFWSAEPPPPSKRAGIAADAAAERAGSFQPLAAPKPFSHSPRREPSEVPPSLRPSQANGRHQHQPGPSQQQQQPQPPASLRPAGGGLAHHRRLSSVGGANGTYPEDNEGLGGRRASFHSTDPDALTRPMSSLSLGQPNVHKPLPPNHDGSGFSQPPPHPHPHRQGSLSGASNFGSGPPHAWRQPSFPPQQPQYPGSQYPRTAPPPSPAPSHFAPVGQYAPPPVHPNSVPPVLPSESHFHQPGPAPVPRPPSVVAPSPSSSYEHLNAFAGNSGPHGYHPHPNPRPLPEPVRSGFFPPHSHPQMQMPSNNPYPYGTAPQGPPPSTGPPPGPPPQASHMFVPGQPGPYQQPYPPGSIPPQGFPPGQLPAPSPHPSVMAPPRAPSTPQPSSFAPSFPPPSAGYPHSLPHPGPPHSGPHPSPHPPGPPHPGPPHPGAPHPGQANYSHLPPQGAPTPQPPPSGYPPGSYPYHYPPPPSTPPPGSGGPPMHMYGNVPYAPVPHAPSHSHFQSYGQSPFP